MTRTALFVQHEIAAALRARWFVLYAGVFLVGGVLLAGLGGGDAVIAGYRGFAKAFTGLVHLALLFVPLMALFPAAAAITEERESGALEYLLAQPVTFGEVYVGKWGGLTAAVFLALTIGFGVAGAVAVLRGVPPGLVLTLYGFVVLLAMAFVSVGLCFSTLTASRAKATTFAVLFWLALVALGTLGVMVAFVRWGVPAGALTIWSFANPVEAFRLGIVSAVDPDLSLLGPVGARIVERLGGAGTTFVSATALAVWVVGPGVTGWLFFRRVR